MTPLFKYHIKTFIFIGNFACQISCETRIPLWIRKAYIDLTVNTPFESKDQINLSGCSPKFISTTEATILCQHCKLFPTKDLLKDTFNGFDDKT